MALLRRRTAEPDIVDTASEASDYEEDDGIAPLDAIINYNSRQGLQRVLGIEGSAVDGNEATVMLPVFMTEMISFVRQMIAHRLSVSLTYSERDSGSGWFLIVDRAQPHLSHVPNLVTIFNSEPKYNGHAALFKLPPTPCRYELNWLRDADFSRFAVKEDGSLTVSVPAVFAPAPDPPAIHEEYPVDTEVTTRPRRSCLSYCIRISILLFFVFSVFVLLWAYIMT